MSGRLVSDELWQQIASLFPQPISSPKGGRPPIDNRTVFTSLVFLLRTGIGWRDLPSELGASSRTVRRRLKEWNEMDLWNQIHQKLLSELRACGQVDLEEVLIDGGLVKAPCGGEKSARIQPIEVDAVAS